LSWKFRAAAIPFIRAQEGQRLRQRICEIQEKSKGTYGVSRIQAELTDEGMNVERKGGMPDARCEL